MVVAAKPPRVSVSMICVTVSNLIPRRSQVSVFGSGRIVLTAVSALKALNCHMTQYVYANSPAIINLAVLTGDIRRDSLRLVILMPKSLPAKTTPKNLSVYVG